MQLLTWIPVLLCVTLPVFAKDTLEKLVVETSYKPADCKVTAKTGDSVVVHYTGTLFSTGEKFDSSRDRNSPLTVMLGTGQVIKGWDEGLQGMCEKEKRRLLIPPEMAYGSRGFGNKIPPNSALVFDVELVRLDSRSKHDEL